MNTSHPQELTALGRKIEALIIDFNNKSPGPRVQENKKKEGANAHISSPNVYLHLMQTDYEHYHFYNMSATQMEELLHLAAPSIVQLASRVDSTNSRIKLQPHMQLDLTLRYLTTGEIVQLPHFNLDLSTARKVIMETFGAIWRVLQPMVLPTETSRNDWLGISENFEYCWYFPHCIGAAKRKYLHIQHPNNSNEQNFAQFTTICDARYMFRYVEATEGSVQNLDETFKPGHIISKFENSDMSIPEATYISSNNDRILPYCLVGDDTFPSAVYMLRSYTKNSADIRKRVFNFRLSQAMEAAKNTFTILTRKWRIFSAPINCTDSVEAFNLFYAAVCLHNWLRAKDLKYCPNVRYVDGSVLGENRGSSDNIAGALKDINYDNSSLASYDALMTREAFCDYFNNEGALDWQYDHV